MVSPHDAGGLGERGRDGAGRVAVIGSGFGGLAAAIRLQAAGVRTVIFEARDRAGGRAYVYRDAGFTFDAGPTVITAPHCLEELFALAGERLADHVELLPVRPFYRLMWNDGTIFDYEGDEAAMRRQIAALSPADEDGYLRFIDYSRRVFEAGYEGLVATPFLRFADMVRVAPRLARLRADRSVYGAVSRFVRDPRLREALSFHALLVGGNPFETSAIYTLIPFLERKWGVFFPRGGTGALVQALVALYQRLGGELRLATPVRRIAVGTRAGRAAHHVVTDADTQAFDAVVSNADIHHTYATLYRDTPAAAPMRARLERMDWSMSLFVIYFGTRRRYPGLAHHTVLFGPRYQALLKEVFHGPALPRDFSLYLHAPSVSDPSLAPPGCETFYVLAPVPHLGSAAVDWAREGEAYAERILAGLERLLPGLRGDIIARRIFTPVDFRDQLGAFQGSAFSVAPQLGQSAYFRPHNRDARIPGLYIVGAGTHPGAGVPGVVSSGKATAGLVLADLARDGQRDGLRRRGGATPGRRGDVVRQPSRSRRSRRGALALARRTLSAHSKSFALAGKLLPAGCRDDAAVIYTWCRRCDDAVDLGEVSSRPAALARLRRELDAIFAGRPQSEPTLAAFQDVIQRRAIPERYPRELLEGMSMDVEATRYRSFDELLVYCFRVAGTVGLMMCHVMGVSDPKALRRAADLGIAMQLTNICRDVAEDWDHGRLYLPQELLGAGASAGQGPGAGLGLPAPVAAGAVEVLLARADDFYRSGDAGLPALDFRCAVAVRTARLIYSEIGRVIARRGHDVMAGRAFVSLGHKVRLALRGLVTEIAARLRGLARSPS